MRISAYIWGHNHIKLKLFLTAIHLVNKNNLLITVGFVCFFRKILFNRVFCSKLHEVSYQLLPSDQQRLDLYFSLPDEMGIGPKTLEEEHYFNNSIQSRSAYYSDQLHIPLIRSRFISQQKCEQSYYRLNLNLFSYQIRIALDTDIKQTIKFKEGKDFYPQAIVLAEQISGLLKS
ncbi:MAG: hypothetical protein ACI9J4_001226 [Paraglaciecola sp.]|jgi:hypothetical protein